MKRTEHSFQFSATDIAEAAQAEALYHEERLAYWEAELESSIQILEGSVTAKVVRRNVTGGQTIDVQVVYGNNAAWSQAQRAINKIQTHRADAEQFRTDERVYGSQSSRVYDLDTEDVHHFRLGGAPRDE